VESELGHGSSFYFTLPTQASGTLTAQPETTSLPLVK
jgi:hypothetical protein